MPDQPWSQRESKPDQTRFDRFALIHLARRESLSVTEWALLAILTFLADWRSQSWLGSLANLANDARMSTNTARKALARLEAKGLIAMVQPFEHYLPGEVRVVCYAELLVLTKAQGQVNVGTADHDRRATLRDTGASTSDFAADVRTRDAPKEQGADESRATGWDEDEPFDTDLCFNCRDAAQFEDDDGRLYCGACRP